MNTTKFFWICLAWVASASLSACNTVKGMGQDVQKAGTAIENAATKK